MIRRNLLRLRTTDADAIFNDLSTRQHVRPHRKVLESLCASSEELGFTLASVEGAIQSLQLDPAAAIGRLRRTQLSQLARSIHRLWRRSIAEESGRSEPAPALGVVSSVSMSLQNAMVTKVTTPD